MADALRAAPAHRGITMQRIATERPAMTTIHLEPATRPMPRPGYVLLAIVLELFTALGAIPVGLQLVRDPSGAAIGLPSAWIEASPFGTYLVPGLYLLLVNGVGMLVLAGLTLARHPASPWLTGVLGMGLIIWILVQIAVLPEVSPLQAAFGAIGVVLVGLSVAWLRATGQVERR